MIRYGTILEYQVSLAVGALGTSFVRHLYGNRKLYSTLDVEIVILLPVPLVAILPRRALLFALCLVETGHLAQV